MRLSLLVLPIALLVGGGVANAQGYPPMGAPYPAYAPAPAQAGVSQAPRGSMAENCGTPDEPKPCPPMPRVDLQYYPANKR